MEHSLEANWRRNQLKAAVPPKRAREEEELQTNKTMEDLTETRDKFDRVRKTLARTREDQDMGKRLIKDCNKKQGEEIEHLRMAYKEQSILVCWLVGLSSVPTLYNPR